MEKVVFAEGMTAIPPYALGAWNETWFCTSVEEVVLPSTVQTIETAAFRGCKGLKTINFPSRLATINSNAFRDCSSLTSISLPSNVTNIYGGAFSGCSNLSNVTLNNGLEYIGSNAFSGTAITEITVPYTVKTMNSENSSYYESCFSGAKSLEKVVFAEGMTAIPPYALGAWNETWFCTSVEEVVLPSTVQTIETAAFRGCKGLKTINFPSRLATINSNAFRDCSSLTSISLPSNVTNIYGEAFSGCSNLSNVTLNSLKQQYLH